MLSQKKKNGISFVALYVLIFCEFLFFKIFSYVKDKLQFTLIT